MIIIIIFFPFARKGVWSGDKNILNEISLYGQLFIWKTIDEVGCYLYLE